MSQRLGIRLFACGTHTAKVSNTSSTDFSDGQGNRSYFLIDLPANIQMFQSDLGHLLYMKKD